MDILRKELNSVYAGQHLECEVLDYSYLERYREQVASMAAVSNACYVITDAAADSCFIVAGSFAHMLGISDEPHYRSEYASSDEDLIYNRIHPEDLVEKRMLEYDFFRFIDRTEATLKCDFHASCRLRIRNRHNEYIRVQNTTRILHPSPQGKIWLILCSYELASDQGAATDIAASINNHLTGLCQPLQLGERRRRVLSEREKEILHLIREGRPSKQIADKLKISIHTVNRHRQNILQKLSVGNSHEAISAATAMKLL